jgi:hypothetical protein
MSQVFLKGGALDPDGGAARRPTGRNEKNNNNRTATTDAFIGNLRLLLSMREVTKRAVPANPFGGLIVRRHRFAQIV